MKILYIAHDRSDAVAGSAAIRRMSPDAAVAWTSRFEDAAHWILENRDVAALVLEAQVGTQPCGSFLKHVRRLGLTAPAIVLTPAGAGVPVDALSAGADDYLPKNQVLLRDLPAAVRRAIDRPRPSIGAAAARPSQSTTELRIAPVAAPPDARPASQAQFNTVMTEAAAARDALARKLAEAQAAVERAERARATDAAAAADQLAQRNHAFTVSLAEVIHSRDALEQRLAETGLALERARRDREAEAAAAAERQAGLEARVDQEATNRIAAERSVTAARQKLREVETALENAEARHAAEAATAAAELVERQARHDAELAQVTAIRDGLEQKLSQLELALQGAQELLAANEANATKLAERNEELTGRLERAQRDQASSALEVERLTEYETELTAALADATSLREALERRLADAEAAFAEAEARATRDRQEAAGRQAALDARFEGLRDEHRALEERLASTEAARQRAEEQHGSDMAAAAAQFAERHAQDEIRLAIAGTAAAEKLAQREQELGARVAEIARERDALNRRLADTETALQTAHERGVRERLHAAEQARKREAEFEGALKQETEKQRAAQDLLARMERANQEAEAKHASALATALAQIAEGQARLEAERTHAAAIRDGLERRLSEAETAGERARQDHASAAAEVERLTRRETELGAMFREAIANAGALERRLAESEEARRLADEAATRERQAAAQQAGERQAEFEARIEQAAQREADLQAQLGQSAQRAANLQAQLVQAAQRETDLQRQLAQETDVRRGIEQRLSDAEAAGRTAEARHAAAVDNLTRRQTELGASLAAATANAGVLGRRLAESEEARREAAETAMRERLAAAQEAAQRQADLEERLDQAARREADLQTQLAQAVQRDSDLDAQLAEASHRETDLQTQLSRETDVRRNVERRLSEAEAAARAAEANHAAAIDGLTRQQTELGASLAAATSNAGALERRLAESEEARRQADESALQARLAAAREAAEREAELEARLDQAGRRETELQTELAQARDEHRKLQGRLDHEHAARQRAEERHALDLAAASDEFAQRHAQDEIRMAVAVAAAAERLALRENELADQLAVAAAAHDDLERRLRETEQSRRDADEAATRDRLAAAEQAAERQAAFEARLAEARDERHAVEKRLGDAEIARRDGEARHASEMTSVTAQFADRQARLEGELAQAAAAREALGQHAAEIDAALARARRDLESNAAVIARQAKREAELSALLAESKGACEALELQRVGTEQLLKAAEDRAARERLAAMERQAEVAARLAAETDRRKSIEEELADTRAAAEASQRLYVEEVASLNERAREQAAELTATNERDRAEYETRLAALQEQARQLDALVAERDTQLGDLTARYSASEQAAKHAFTQLQEGFQSALAAHRREVEQLQAELGSAARELDTTGKEREALRAEASQVPQLQSRLDGLRNEIDRQFVQHPTPLCRCTREGVITHVNRAFAAMVGCPVVDLQRGVRVASTLFQASDDLTWLVERSLTAGSAGPIELTWKSEDGTRLFVRLSALACADAIEIVAQDITAHRATQDRLAQAQRMEAVGRLASEVAVTCGNLLRDVSQNGQRWLAALDVNTALQHQGEMLLDDVTRAASFLRKLAVYGDEQTSALEPVDLHRVLRDLEPVLKEVAGDDIELVLPKSPPRSSPPFHVDLRAERVERLLVNVASYGRERMPLGGSLIFDLAPTVVDRQFTEKYPNVRQGPHVLLTVTEARGAVRSVGPHGFREELAEAHDAPLAVEKPGVDLSALQGLVRECGGHLWMEAAPPGDMVIKIHLPLRPHDDSARGEPQTAGQARGPLGRWFHH